MGPSPAGVGVGTRRVHGASSQSSPGPGPAVLYPSVIYGWAQWRLERLNVPAGHPRGVLLQRPPLRLGAIVRQDT